MMSSAEMRDPDVLRAFIASLTTFNSELETRCRNLTAHWAGLQSTWRDPQCERFANGWEVTVKSIQGYLADSSQYVDHLNTKLRQVEDYDRR